jgi:hypothetical protein
VERAWSNYHYARSHFGATAHLAEFILDHPGVIGRSLYTKQLRRFLDHFPREQLHIEVTEDMAAAPMAAIHRIYTFLGLTTAVAPVIGPANRSVVPHAPRVWRMARRVTQTLYAARMGRIVGVVKRTPIRAALLREQSPPPPTEAEHRLILDAVLDDTLALTPLLGTDVVHHWRRGGHEANR